MLKVDEAAEEGKEESDVEDRVILNLGAKIEEETGLNSGDGLGADKVGAEAADNEVTGVILISGSAFGVVDLLMSDETGKDEADESVDLFPEALNPDPKVSLLASSSYSHSPVAPFQKEQNSASTIWMQSHLYWIVCWMHILGLSGSRCWRETKMEGEAGRRRGKEPELGVA